jgi:hypothetical protein
MKMAEMYHWFEIYHHQNYELQSFMDLKRQNYVFDLVKPSCTFILMTNYIPRNKLIKCNFKLTYFLMQNNLLGPRYKCL